MDWASSPSNTSVEVPCATCVRILKTRHARENNTRKVTTTKMSWQNSACSPTTWCRLGRAILWKLLFLCVCVFFFFRMREKHFPSANISPMYYYAFIMVPTSSLSRGRDVAVHVFDINQSSLPTPFYSVFVSISDVLALSTVFHSKNSPTTLRFLTLFFRSCFCLICLFNYMKVSFSPLLYGWLGSEHQLTNLQP